MLYGLKLLGDKKLAGFWVTLVGEALWIAWGILDKAWALVAMSIVISLMYVRGIRNWGRDVSA